MKKMFLLLTIIIILATMIAVLCSCSGNDHAVHTDPDAFDTAGFVIISSEGSNQYILVKLYDKETKVMYLYIKSGYSGGLTMLYNADGTPKLYKGK